MGSCFLVMTMPLWDIRLTFTSILNIICGNGYQNVEQWHIFREEYNEGMYINTQRGRDPALAADMEAPPKSNIIINSCRWWVKY